MARAEPFEEDLADDVDVLDDDSADSSRVAESPSVRSSRTVPKRWRTLVEGDVVARKYRISSVSRRTGRMVTATARHLELDQVVTLTYLAPDACEEPGKVSGFTRKARLIARVPSRNCAKVLDIGRFVIGSPFVVLEHLPGWTFAEVLRVRGALPVAEAARYVGQAARGIAEAHAVGIRPVGVNPHNLVLTRESNGAAVVKVVLIGADNADPDEILRSDLARNDDSDVLSLLPYVAPEHVRHQHHSDPSRADVWALGTVLYELVTGVQAFSASSATGLLAAIVADEVPEIRRERSDAPLELDAVLARCLAKEPVDRYSSVSELAAALEPFCVASDDTPFESRPPAARVSSRPPPLPSLTPPPSRAIVTAKYRGSEVARKARVVDRGVGLAAGIALGFAGLLGMQALRSTATQGATSSTQATAPVVAPQGGSPVVAPAALAPAPLSPAPLAAPVAPAGVVPVVPATVPLSAAQVTPSQLAAAQLALAQLVGAQQPARPAALPVMRPPASRPAVAQPSQEPTGASSVESARDAVTPQPKQASVQNGSPKGSGDPDLFDELR